MAESTLYLDGSSEFPPRGTELDGILGQLATHLQIAGQTWVDWSGRGRAALVTRNRQPFDGSFLRLIPKTLPDRSHGHRVIVDKTDIPRAGVVAIEHVFDIDWAPASEGKVQVFDQSLHTYW